MDAPIISILSAIGGTLTLALAIDPLFPLATTTVWVIDAATGQPIITVTAQVPPTVVIAAVPTDGHFFLIAQTFDTGSSTLSPASAPLQIENPNWQGALKTYVQGDAVQNARSYNLYNMDTQVLLQNSIYPVFLDTQIFLTEQAAQLFRYQIKAVVNDIEICTDVVGRFRTTKAFCLVTGEMTTPRGDGFYNWGVIFTYREEQRWPQDPPFYQRALPIFHEVKAYPNYLGQWGTYLIQSANVEAVLDLANRKRVEFIVPVLSTAELADLPLVPRPFVPKNT